MNNEMKNKFKSESNSSVQMDMNGGSVIRWGHNSGMPGSGTLNGSTSNWWIPKLTSGTEIRKPDPSYEFTGKWSATQLPYVTSLDDPRLVLIDDTTAYTDEEGDWAVMPANAPAVIYAVWLKTGVSPNKVFVKVGGVWKGANNTLIKTDGEWK